MPLSVGPETGKENNFFLFFHSKYFIILFHNTSIKYLEFCSCGGRFGNQGLKLAVKLLRMFLKFILKIKIFFYTQNAFNIQYTRGQGHLRTSICAR